jgi:diguanylate cyclase (GGDEF)-like protein
VITEELNKRVYWLLWVSFIVIVVNGVLNFTVRHTHFMGYVCIVTSLGLFLICISFKYNRNMKLTYLRALIIISIHILAIAAYKGSRPSALLWIYPLPLLAFYIQGSRIGILYSSSLFILVFFIRIINSIFFSVNDLMFSGYIETVIVFLIIIVLTFNNQLILQKKEYQIKIQLFYDELTGLPKRKKLVQDVKKYFSKTLILINIDGFGRINSLIGVEGGDYVLKQTSNRLLKFSAQYSTFNLYKLSSDEFALLIPGLESPSTIKKLVDQINSIIKEEIIIDNSSIIITASMGISSTVEKILTTCDIALKMAKKQRKPYVIYNNSLNIPQLHKENLTQLYRLQKAIGSENIVPFFQPIYNNRTNSIYKYECLIRLKEEGEIISPAEFLELSKGAKIYPILTQIMISKSFEYFSGSDFHFSINLSLDDILDGTTTEHLYSELERYNIGKQVTFEFLESEQIEQFPEVIEFINKIKSYNCSIAIDDFGAGYSNFDLLLKIHFDYIKIDGSIIKNISHDRKAQVLVETLVDFAGKLGAKTIAEYVKDKDTFEKVNQFGIDYSQGFYIGKPEEKILQNIMS